VLYKHRRLGLGGKEFWCLKFRTMAADAEEQLKRNAKLQQQFAGNFKIKDDPRITRLGSFLRKTSLDELPQLVSILLGEMSLIGPRAIVKTELDKYSIYGKKLLSVKPGLSGLWQVSGRSNVEYPDRVFLDMHYIDHRCLLLDIQLLFRTPIAVLKGDGAC
jgi:lipopolysaccharide/colanic/teichoic acid biosynthesis glycosyltransferase